ncbi:Uncharacterised protein [uncultured Clostridium sp.]|nr:Uncharacterised protein [uncultured Clostridium sp.]
MALQPNQNIGGNQAGAPGNLGDIMQNQTGNTDFPENANQFFYESFSEVLSKAIGYFVVCEFLIGNAIVEKSGILYAAGVNFVTLENPANGSFTVCDIYSLKFATFYDTTEVPEEFVSTTGSVTVANTNTAPANNGFPQRNNYQNPYLPRRGNNGYR